MGKKSKRQRPKTTAPPPCFLTMIETRPSPVHGVGGFATKDIPKGTYQVRNFMNPSKMQFNASYLPPWRAILATVLTEDGSIPKIAFSDLHEGAKAALRDAWLDFEQREESMMELRFEGMGFKCFQNLKCFATVHQDIAKGEEIFRIYGHDWLQLQYGHLMGTLALDQQDELNFRLKGKTLNMFVDLNEMKVQPTYVPSTLEDAQDTEKWDSLIQRWNLAEGKDLVRMNTGQRLFLAECMKYLAELYLVGHKDKMMEFQWVVTSSKYKK